MIGQRDGVGEVGAGVGGPGPLALQPLERRSVAGVDHCLHPLGVEPVDADVNDVLGATGCATRQHADRRKEREANGPGDSADGGAGTAPPKTCVGMEAGVGEGLLEMAG